MRCMIELTMFAPAENGKGYEPFGGAHKDFECDEIEQAKDEARDWVRRNRLLNSENQDLRWKAVVKILDMEAWLHDETAGDALLLPTDDTRAPSCS